MHTIYYKDAIAGEMVTGYLLIGEIEPQIDTTLEELSALQYFDGEPFFGADVIQGGQVSFVFPEFPNGTDVNVYGLFVLNKDGELLCAAKLDQPIHGQSGDTVELQAVVIPYKALKPPKLAAAPLQTIECSQTAIIMYDMAHKLRTLDIKPIGILGNLVASTGRKKGAKVPHFSAPEVPQEWANIDDDFVAELASMEDMDDNG